MPRNIGRHARDECGQPLDLITRIVESGDQQRDDLDPEVHRMQAADGVENRTDASAELAVVPIVEALEIDFVEIHPGLQILEHLWRPVAVGHVSRRQSRRSGFLEDGDRPLARDQGLVVGADDDLRPLTQRILDEALGVGFERRRHGVGIAQRLRRHPVLTVRTVQIAAEHPEAVRQRTGMRVEERLLLVGIALHAVEVQQKNKQTSALVEADLAHANRAFRQRTAMSARVAAQTSVGQRFVELAFTRLTREDLS